MILLTFRVGKITLELLQIFIPYILQEKTIASALEANLAHKTHETMIVI